MTRIEKRNHTKPISFNIIFKLEFIMDKVSVYYLDPINSKCTRSKQVLLDENFKILAASKPTTPQL